ncbi:hypothetical protein V5O48_011990 [Marasmius crinis-equi]|uniref:Uncharacterized protein n=1 Tax=Marasmius crinis-equi TaxID=585013 RepID=A0ABR3F425_9AGAR
MAQPDALLLQDIGSNLVIKVARVVAETVCYGVYLVLIYFFIGIFHRRQLHTLRSIFLAAVVTVMFLGCSAFLAMDIADLVVRMRVVFVKNPDAMLQDKEDQADAITEPLLWTGEMLFIFMAIYVQLTLGDSVVVWRTWALYRDQLKVLVVPFLTLTGSFIAALYELGCDLKTHWALLSNDPSAGSVGAASCAKADTTSFSMSFATNIICTGLIIYRAWEHRQYMRKQLGGQHQRTQVDRVLTLFCESGSIYLILYILQAIPIYGGSPSPDALIALEIINAIVQQAMGMYPTTIVVICQLQRSLWDTFEVPSISVHGSASTSTAREPGFIQFAHPQTRTMTSTTSGSGSGAGGGSRNRYQLPTFPTSSSGVIDIIDIRVEPEKKEE